MHKKGIKVIDNDVIFCRRKARAKIRKVRGFSSTVGIVTNKNLISMFLTNCGIFAAKESIYPGNI